MTSPRPGVLIALAAIIVGLVAHAQERSLIEDSTILGENFGYPAGAHLDGTSSDDRPADQHLDFAVETVLFFKNLEIVNQNSLDGETYFGVIAPLRLRYRAAEAFTIEGGVILGQNFGDRSSFDTVQPLVRLAYELTENVFLIGGTILPTHTMNDALLDDVRVFDDPAEQGIQFRVNGEFFKQDLWLNWRIRENQRTAEEFEIGSSSRFLVEGWTFDAQLLWDHVGGQQNNTMRVENNLAADLGASWGSGFGKHHSTWLDEVRGGLYGLVSYDDITASTGTGVDVFLRADFSPTDKTFIRAEVAQFFGDGFVARHGDPLYQFDSYTRVGADSIVQLDGNVRLEVGGVLQLVDSEANWSLQFNFVWNGAFPIPTAY